MSKGILIGILLWITGLVVLAQSPDDEPLQFTDYGPVAFESFWRLPDATFSDFWEVQTQSRVSETHLPGNYFTQYIQLSAPLGAGNVLQIRTPRHFFSVPQSTATQLDMARLKGNTWGDLDFAFHLQILRKWKPVASGKWSIYLTGELHTAPTNRSDRQFTDALKMLGTITTRFQVWKNETSRFMAIVSLGGGGWEDNIVPRQNHSLKVSSRMVFEHNFSSQWITFGNLGQTYLSAERANDQGLMIYGQIGLEAKKTWRLALGLGRINYTENIDGHVNRADMSLSYRFKI